MVGLSWGCSEDDANSELVVDENRRGRATNGFERHPRFHSVYDAWDRCTELVDRERELFLRLYFNYCDMRHRLSVHFALRKRCQHPAEDPALVIIRGIAMDVSLSPIFICGDNRVPCAVSGSQASQPISGSSVDQPENQARRQLVPKIPPPELPAVVYKAEADSVIRPTGKISKTGGFDCSGIRDIVQGHFVREAVKQILAVGS